MYIWDRSGWPAFTWAEQSLSKLLATVSREQGRLLGQMGAPGFDLRSEAHLRTVTEDVVKTSEIEGEKLDSDQVRSSIARRLGLDVGGLIPSARDVDGIVELMLDATGGFEKSLTSERLFDWHAALMALAVFGVATLAFVAWRFEETVPRLNPAATQLAPRQLGDAVGLHTGLLVDVDQGVALLAGAIEHE